MGQPIQRKALSLEGPEPTRKETDDEQHAGTGSRDLRHGIGLARCLIRGRSGHHRCRRAAPAKLAQKIKNGGSGVWGQIPMPPNNVPDADLKTLAEWILAQK
jgi:hypothetical protein